MDMIKDILHRGWPQSHPNESCLIVGYPDDEGIANNKGRPGARQGPQEIRQRLYSMTLPFGLDKELLFEGFLCDGGDLDGGSLSLFERHELAKAQVERALQSGHRLLSFGGGHDYGYPDGAGFAQVCLSLGQRPLVINFDAHLDVRPSEGGINSGTPFYRLLQEFKEVDLIEVGIQEQCNSAEHWSWALKQGARILPLFELQKGDGPQALTKALAEALGQSFASPPPAPTSRPPCYLSVDIDAFSSSYAPGASASWPSGLEPNSFILTLRWLLERYDVRVMGIYEVSPPLDVDSRTSKLAALLAFEYIFAPLRLGYHGKS